MAEQRVYSEQLRHLGNGLPLFEPDPAGQYDKVRVGDVGYVSRGAFLRMFNVFYSRDSPINSRGVPEGFEPIDPAYTETQRRTPIPRGLIRSNSVRTVGIGARVGEGLNIALPTNATLSFSCTSTKGAILMTNTVAYREDTLHDRRLRKYMFKNLNTWSHFIRERLGRDIQSSQIILVSGCDLTAEWATACFLNNQTEASISFEVGAGLGGAGIWGRWFNQYAVMAPTRCGPIPVIPPDVQDHEHSSALTSNTHQPTSNSRYNQCIFLRGVRIAGFPRILRRIRAAASPVDLGGPPPPENQPAVRSDEGASDEDEEEDIYDIISELIHESTNADYVILHDEDVTDILSLSKSNNHDDLRVVTADYHRTLVETIDGHKVSSWIHIDLDTDGVS